MPNPQKKMYRLLGTFFFRLPHNQRRWKACREHYMPILDGVFIDNEAALLMIMRCLEKIEGGDIEGAQRIIEYLRPLFAANEKHPPVLVLWHVLHALHQSRSGHMAKMSANLRTANKLGHRYHIAHALYAEDISHRLHFYDEAEEHFSKAVDCIYAWPPLTERARQVIGLLHTRIAYVRTMMHRYDEARDALRIAESMQATPESLSHSRALLNAALRLPTEAYRYLEHLRETSAEASDELAPIIQRILAEEHPHFTQMPVGSPEGIAAFWQNFLHYEDEMMQLLRDNRRRDARELMAGPLRAMDPYQGDYFGFDLSLRNNVYTIQFRSNFSLTYSPFIDAILSACPDVIRQHWRIVRKP